MKQSWEVIYQMPEGETPHLWCMHTCNKIGEWARELIEQNNLTFSDYNLTVYADDENFTLRAELAPREVDNATDSD